MKVDINFDAASGECQFLITGESNPEQALLKALKSKGNVPYTVDLPDIDVERRLTTIVFSVPFK